MITFHHTKTYDDNDEHGYDFHLISQNVTRFHFNADKKPIVNHFPNIMNYDFSYSNCTVVPMADHTYTLLNITKTKR